MWNLDLDLLGLLMAEKLSMMRISGKTCLHPKSGSLSRMNLLSGSGKNVGSDLKVYKKIIKTMFALVAHQ